MRIALVSPIDTAAIDLLAARHDVLPAVGLTGVDLEQAIGDREILVARSGVAISAELLRQAPSARLVIRAGSGLDNLDVEYMREADPGRADPRTGREGRGGDDVWADPCGRASDRRG